MYTPSRCMSAGLRQMLAIVVIGGLRARGDVVPTVFQQRNVPEAIRSLSTLASPPYVDLFTITTDRAPRRSPPPWAPAPAPHPPAPPPPFPRPPPLLPP